MKKTTYRTTFTIRTSTGRINTLVETSTAKDKSAGEERNLSKLYLEDGEQIINVRTVAQEDASDHVNYKSYGMSKRDARALFA